MLSYSDDVNERAAHAKFLIGPRQPFTWRNHTTEDPTVGFQLFSKIRRSLTPARSKEYSGLFRSEVILATLASHLNVTASVPLELQVDSPPRGALAISIVSVSTFCSIPSMPHPLSG